MKMIFDLDMDKCSACGACAIACMDQNDIEISEEHPLRKIFAMEGAKGHAYISMACMHCADAPCITACPVGCLSKNELGLTVYDSTNCIGCHSCAMACPFGAPTYDCSGKMQKCDGCAERLAHGMEPACVRTCSVGALKIYTEEEYAQIHTQKSLHKIAEKLV